MTHETGTDDARVAALTARVAQLEALVERLTGTSTPAPTRVTPTVAAPAVPVDRPRSIDLTDTSHGVSRRRFVRAVPAALLAGAGIAAAGAVLAEPAAAADGDPLLMGQENTRDGASTTSIVGPDLGSDVPALVVGYADYGTAIADSGIAVRSPGALRRHLTIETGDPGEQASGHVIVDGSADALLDVQGVEWAHQGSGGYTAISATTRAATAVVAHAVSGIDLGGNDVLGTGLSASAEDAGTAIVATSETGRAISATTRGATSATYTVAATNSGAGAAVWARQSNADATSPAVHGQAGAKGRGGRFAGGAASINLVPSTASSHPWNGLAGDLVVDASNRLWFCKGGSTWVQLA